MSNYEQFINEIKIGNIVTNADYVALSKKLNISDDVAKELYEIAQLKKAREIVNTDQPKYEIYRKLIENYNSQLVINYRSSRSSIFNQFSTPIPVAYALGTYVIGDRNENDLLFYDSTAGNGLLTVAFNPNNTKVNEFEQIRFECLKKAFAGNWIHVYQNDASEPMPRFNFMFDGIIANPPFHAPSHNKKSIELEGQKITDFDKIITYHTLSTMKDNGRAALILDGSPGSKIYETTFWNDRLYKKGNERGFWFWIYRNFNVEDLIYIAGHKLLSRQGQATNWRVILINGRKPYDKKALPPLYNENYDKLIESFDELWQKVNSHLKTKNENVKVNNEIPKLLIKELELLENRKNWKVVFESDIDTKTKYYSNKTREQAVKLAEQYLRIEANTAKNTSSWQKHIPFTKYELFEN